MPGRVAIDNPLKRAHVIRRIIQAWLLLMIVGSLQPVRPGAVVALHREIHWLAFAGVAFLMLLHSRSRRQEVNGVIATCLLGLWLECLQHLIYGNAVEWRDVRDDVLATLVALAVYRLMCLCKSAFGVTRGATESEAAIRSAAGPS